MTRTADNPTPRRRGYTLTELLVVIGLIALLISVGVPSVKAMFAGNTIATGRANIGATVAAVRAFSTRQKVLDDGDFMGAAALFMVDENGNRAIRPVIHTDYTDNSPPRPRYTDLEAVSSVVLDPDLGVMGLSRGSSGLELIPIVDNYGESSPALAFAIRFDGNGTLIARRHSGGSQDQVVYYDFDFSDEGSIQVTQEYVHTLVGVMIYDRRELAAAGHSEPDDVASSDEAYDWIMDNADSVLFNRYTGVALEQ